MGSEARLVSDGSMWVVAEWCDGIVIVEHDALDYSATNLAVNLRTVKGVDRAHAGDTIIKNHDGTFQIVKGPM